MRHLVAALSTVLILAGSAFGGWYLMEPPLLVKPGGNVKDQDRFRPADRTWPMDKWYRNGAFDTAKECEAARAKLIEERREAMRAAQRVTPDVIGYERANLAIGESSECFASDDRRLLR